MVPTDMACSRRTLAASLLQRARMTGDLVPETREFRGAVLGRLPYRWARYYEVVGPEHLLQIPTLERASHETTPLR